MPLKRPSLHELGALEGELCAQMGQLPGPETVLWGCQVLFPQGVTSGHAQMGQDAVGWDISNICQSIHPRPRRTTVSGLASPRLHLSC